MSTARENTIPHMFFQQVVKYADRVALRKKRLGRWSEISWREYGRRVREVALGLLALGLRRGEFVSIISENRPEWVYSDVGIIAAGGITIGIYATSSPEQCEYIMNHSESRFHLVEDEEQLQKVLKIRHRLPLLEKIIVLDMKGLRGFQDPMVITFEQLLVAGREYDEALPDRFRRSLEETKSEDIAIVVYTSGTTGPPKGAMLSHETILFATTLLGQIGPIRETDETISYLPLSHIAQRLVSTFGQIRYGYTVNFVESLDTFPQNLREISPQMFFGPPRTWEKLYSGIILRMERATRFKRWIFGAAVAIGSRAAKRRLSGQSLPVALRLLNGLARLVVFRKLKMHLGLGRARYVLTGAAPISHSLMEFFQSIGVPLKESYGQTESCGPATAHLGDRIKLGTVGQAIPGCEVSIAGDGEILLRGKNIFQGYFKDSRATKETFRDGWLCTGDLGELDGEGFLKLTDRKKDLIITAGGKNIAPQVIENQLKSSPYIADAVVIGERRHYLVALIVIDDENVTGFAGERRIPFTTFSDLSRKQEVHTLIGREVERVNSALSPVEMIKRFAILDKKLDPEDGDVTPTMKVKRKAISDRYREVIDALYD